MFLCFFLVVPISAYYRPIINTTGTIWHNLAPSAVIQPSNVITSSPRSRDWYNGSDRGIVLDLHRREGNFISRRSFLRDNPSSSNLKQRGVNEFSIAVSNAPSLLNTVGLDQDGNDVSYFSTLNIGSAGKKFRCVMDTGSSDLWVPSSSCQDSPCRNHQTFGPADSTSYRQSDQVWKIQYGSGAAEGVLVKDVISMAGMMTEPVVFGVAKRLTGSFASFPADGILGLGSRASSNQKVPTFMDNLITSGMTTRKLVAFNIHRKTGGDNDNDGQVSFGMIDTSKFAGSMVTTPNIAEGGLWEAKIEAITVAGMRIAIGNAVGIIDTGTTLLIAPPIIATMIHAQLPGAQSDDKGSFNIPCNTAATIELTFGGQAFPIDKRDYVGRSIDGRGLRCLSRITGQDIGGKYLVGDVFLKNTYTVFDFDHNEIGFGRKTT